MLVPEHHQTQRVAGSGHVGPAYQLQLKPTLLRSCARLEIVPKKSGVGCSIGEESSAARAMFGGGSGGGGGVYSRTPTGPEYLQPLEYTNAAGSAEVHPPPCLPTSIHPSPD